MSPMALTGSIAVLEVVPTVATAITGVTPAAVSAANNFRSCPGSSECVAGSAGTLRTAATESGQVTDYRDWQIQLGRRFRALKLWAVIRCYGAAGLREHIRRGVALAADFAGWVAADGRFELAAPHPLSLVCFRLRCAGSSSQEQDTRNLALMNTLNESGRLLLTHTRIGGRVVLRLAIGGTLTRREHVEQAWQAIAAAAGADSGTAADL